MTLLLHQPYNFILPKKGIFVNFLLTLPQSICPQGVYLGELNTVESQEEFNSALEGFEVLLGIDVNRFIRISTLALDRIMPLVRPDNSPITEQ